MKINGKRLKLLRLHCDISREQISHKLNIDKNLISIYENERQSIPDEVYNGWIAFLGTSNIA